MCGALVGWLVGDSCLKHLFFDLKNATSSFQQPKVASKKDFRYTPSLSKSHHQDYPTGLEEIFTTGFHSCHDCVLSGRSTKNSHANLKGAPPNATYPPGNNKALLRDYEAHHHPLRIPCLGLISWGGGLGGPLEIPMNIVTFP